MATIGKLTNSQLKVQSCFYDCSDPAINFTDGSYNSDIALKNKSFVYGTYIKYLQDISAYPAMLIRMFVVGGGYNMFFSNEAIPYANIVDGYRPGTVVPSGGVVSGCNNNNNCLVGINITGMTGSGITSLSFEIVIMYVELDF